MRVKPEIHVWPNPITGDDEICSAGLHKGWWYGSHNDKFDKAEKLFRGISGKASEFKKLGFRYIRLVVNGVESANAVDLK